MKYISRIYLYLLLLFFVFLATVPFLWMAVNSFSSEAGVFRVPPRLIPDLIGTKHFWDNYIAIFRQFNFGRYSLNSLFVSGASAIGQVLVCSLSGYVFALMNFRGKKLIFSVLIFTLMVPVQVTIIPEYFLMMKLNWLNSYLPLIIPSFLVGSFGTFMFKEFYETIPPSISDAGIIDGAGAAMMFTRIYFPQSGPQAATLFIIAFMNSWNDLLRPILYISDDSMQTVTMALTQFQSQYTARWNLLLAGGVLSVMPLLILFVFLQRYIIENSISSGIKG